MRGAPMWRGVALTLAVLLGCTGTARAQEHVSVANLRETVDVLCSEECAGRKFGTPGGALAAEFLLQKLRDFGFEPYVQEIPDGAFPVPGAGRNVLAVWTPGGTPPQEGAVSEEGEPRRYLVLCAHYDHVGVRADGTRFPGALDNASGTAVLLEVARLLRARDRVPGEWPENCAVVLLFADAEELGMLGSRFWVENPTVPRDQIAAAFALDMVGAFGLDPDSAPNPDSDSSPDSVRDIFLFGTRTGSGFREVALRAGVESAEALRLRFPFEALPRSDHYAFIRAGIPAVLLVSGAPGYIHTTRDTPDRLDFTGMAQVAELLYHMAHAAAAEVGTPGEVRFRAEWRGEKFRSTAGEDAYDGFWTHLKRAPKRDAARVEEQSP